MPTPEQRELVQQLYQQGIKDERVLQAIYETPRPHFVDEAFAHRCYDDIVPISEGQTLTHPYTSARMTDLLQIEPHHHILEIGTGSGYQTAVLAKLAAQVFTVERIKKLQWQAVRRLKQLDLYNIQFKHDDGWQGWQAKAPFDGIIVTAAPTTVPIALLQQLKDNGRLVLPVGSEDQQELQRITRYGDKFYVEHIEPAKFVPLIEGEII